MSDIILGKDPNQLTEEIQKMKDVFHTIEVFFQKKVSEIEDNKTMSVDTVLANAPSYYPLVRFLERFYIAITNDKEWLQNYVVKKKINFNWTKYQLWVSGKTHVKRRYDDTLCPSSWITDLINMLTEMLKMLQVLLYIEAYVPEQDFKTFLRKNPAIDYKYKANFLQKSPPSQDLDVFFKVIDTLVQICNETNASNIYDIDTRECIRAYRFIDDSGIMNILKQKDFYITYHLELLRKMPRSERFLMPDEVEVMKTAEKFCETFKVFFFTFNDYKKVLIEKQSHIRKILK